MCEPPELCLSADERPAHTRLAVYDASLGLGASYFEPSLSNPVAGTLAWVPADMDRTNEASRSQQQRRRRKLGELQFRPDWEEIESRGIGDFLITVRPRRDGRLPCIIPVHIQRASRLLARPDSLVLVFKPGANRILRRISVYADKPVEKDSVSVATTGAGIEARVQAEAHDEEDAVVIEVACDRPDRPHRAAVEVNIAGRTLRIPVEVQLFEERRDDENRRL